jgi:hypothetical protein
MPLSSGSPPSHSTRVFRKWVARPNTATRGKRIPEQRHPNKPFTPAPHRVAVLTIPQLIAGEGLRKARRVAWCHFAPGPRAKQQVSAEIVIVGRLHRVARTYGSRATSIITKALSALAKKYSRTKTYQSISLVKIPPLVGLAVWVRGRNAKEDLIFTLESVLPELQRDTAHNYVDSLPLLQRSAKALVAQSLALDVKLRKGPARRAEELKTLPSPLGAP